jgi:hypothetical protein
VLIQIHKVLWRSPSKAGGLHTAGVPAQRQPVPTLQALGRPGSDLREAEDNISLHVKPAALDRAGATLITSSNVTTLRGKGHRPTSDQGLAKRRGDWATPTHSAGSNGFARSTGLISVNIGARHGPSIHQAVRDGEVFCEER